MIGYEYETLISEGWTTNFYKWGICHEIKSILEKAEKRRENLDEVVKRAVKERNGKPYDLRLEIIGHEKYEVTESVEGKEVFKAIYERREEKQ